METAALTSATTATASAKSSRNALSGDFDTFLKMLTVQMQNQDPLNPIDAEDYAVQLATFSGVEQQTRTNQLLETLSSQMDLLGLTELAAWVGQDARVAADVAFAGTPVTLAPSPDERADAAVLVVRDARGALVARESVPLDAESYVWQGRDATGAPLPSGTYALTLESLSGERVLSTTAVESWQRIEEVRRSADGPMLVLPGGVTVTADKANALRIGAL